MKCTPLKGIRELLRNPEQFLLQYYSPVKVVDSFRYLHPETQPAFHKDSSCERLHSNFQNIEIPFAIRDKGPDEVIKFREWYRTTEFEEGNPKDFIYKLQLKFPYVGEVNPSSIEYSNSGVAEKRNYSLSELENEIDKILRAAGQYFTQNPDKQSIIRRYQKLTFLAYVYGEIRNNDSGLNDDELKEFLKEYDEKFKKPVKYLLEEYYRIKFNPELTFEGALLSQLGFKQCGACLPEEGEDKLIYDEELNNYINSFIQNNVDLLKVIVGTHYAFSHEELELYWNKIPKGTAHYAEYLADTETWYEPQYGLCWNSNVTWSNWLLNKWCYENPNDIDYTPCPEGKLRIGFWDPYIGDNRGATTVPLDLSGEDDIISRLVRRYHPDPDEVEVWGNYLGEVQKFMESIRSELTLNEVVSLLEGEVYKEEIRQLFITSASIWSNTFSKWITRKEIDMIFG